MFEITPIFWKRVRDLACIGVGGAVIFSAIAHFKNDTMFYRHVTGPLLHRLDPETSHRVAVLATKYKLVPRRRQQPDHRLGIKCLGLDFRSPIGLAAGFDKHGEAVEGLYGLGFGLVEIGSVTPHPQVGNPKPRNFRLAEDLAVINRYGFNSVGHDEILLCLHSLPPPGQREAALGINLGKNKDSADHVNDYRLGVRKLGPLADYLVINVSSPNTPGLRGLQSGGALGELLDGVMEERGALKGHTPPLLVKIAPDLSNNELEEICSVLVQKKVDGVIACNTTLARPPSLKSEHRGEVGGLSGAPLKQMSLRVIRRVAEYTQGRLPIIGCGGVSTGEDVYDMLQAGASLVQLYTGLVYGGPGLVEDLEKDLLLKLEKEGFSSVEEMCLKASNKYNRTPGRKS